MIIKKIETFLKGNQLVAMLTLQSQKTQVKRYVNVLELAKINIGDDITVNNEQVKIIAKNNKNKYVLQRSCPECGNPLETIYQDKKKQIVEKYICTNLYGCAGQRENLLTKWCIYFKINSLLPLTQEFLDYFNLDNFILDRTKKMAIEKVIPLLYILNEQDINKWLNNPQLATKIYKEIQANKAKITLNSIFSILPNNFTAEEQILLIKEYKTINNFFAISERCRLALNEIFNNDNNKINSLFAFIKEHLETIQLLSIDNL
jgi:NAD-dependent DNA ligase